MSEPRGTSRARGWSTWVWVLVLLPAALMLGRWVGGMHSAPVPAGGSAAGASAAVAGAVRWTPIANAEAESRRTGKPVMYEFGADWCPPCQAMKREVFENPDHARAVMAAVIPVAVTDRSREAGANPDEVEALQQRFQIYPFPTLVVFSPATGRSEKLESYHGPEATREWIAQAATRVR